MPSSWSGTRKTATLEDLAGLSELAKARRKAWLDGIARSKANTTRRRLVRRRPTVNKLSNSRSTAGLDTRSSSLAPLPPLAPLRHVASLPELGPAPAYDAEDSPAPLPPGVHHLPAPVPAAAALVESAIATALSECRALRHRHETQRRPQSTEPAALRPHSTEPPVLSPTAAISRPPPEPDSEAMEYFYASLSESDGSVGGDDTSIGSLGGGSIDSLGTGSLAPSDAGSTMSLRKQWRARQRRRRRRQQLSNQSRPDFEFVPPVRPPRGSRADRAKAAHGRAVAQVCEAEARTRDASAALESAHLDQLVGVKKGKGKGKAAAPDADAAALDAAAAPDAADDPAAARDDPASRFLDEAMLVELERRKAAAHAALVESKRPAAAAFVRAVTAEPSLHRFDARPPVVELVEALGALDAATAKRDRRAARVDFHERVDAVNKPTVASVGMAARSAADAAGRRTGVATAVRVIGNFLRSRALHKVLQRQWLEAAVHARFLQKVRSLRLERLKTNFVRGRAAMIIAKKFRPLVVACRRTRQNRMFNLTSLLLAVGFIGKIRRFKERRATRIIQLTLEEVRSNLGNKQGHIFVHSIRSTRSRVIFCQRRVRGFLRVQRARYLLARRWIARVEAKHAAKLVRWVKKRRAAHHKASAPEPTTWISEHEQAWARQNEVAKALHRELDEHHLAMVLPEPGGDDTVVSTLYNHADIAANLRKHMQTCRGLHSEQSASERKMAQILRQAKRNGGAREYSIEDVRKSMHQAADGGAAAAPAPAPLSGAGKSFGRRRGSVLHKGPESAPPAGPLLLLQRTPESLVLKWLQVAVRDKLEIELKQLEKDREPPVYTHARVDENADAIMRLADREHDGAVSLAEVTGYLRATKFHAFAHWVIRHGNAAMAEFDADGSGSVDPTEIRLLLGKYVGTRKPARKQPKKVVVVAAVTEAFRGKGGGAATKSGYFTGPEAEGLGDE